MPKEPTELPKKDIPGVDENPFFCLLEDDNLITKISVSTNRLLLPINSSIDVQLFIDVNIKPTLRTWGNIGF